MVNRVSSGLMRAFWFLLTALGACTASRVSAPASSTCRVLQVTSPVEYAATDTTAANVAVHDFARYGGAGYTLLYLSFRGGSPDQTRCLRVVQCGPHRFTAYAYRRSGRVDSSTFISPSLATRLAAPAGHFTTLCPDFTSEARYELLWVKQGPTTGFSLAGEWGDLRGPIPPGPALEPLARAMELEGNGMRFLQPADSTRLQPALALLQEVQRLKQ